MNICFYNTYQEQAKHYTSVKLDQSEKRDIFAVNDAFSMNGGKYEHAGKNILVTPDPGGGIEHGGLGMGLNLRKYSSFGAEISVRSKLRAG